MADPTTKSVRPVAPVHPRRLWRWFTIGFLIAFAGMLLFYPIAFYNGRGLYETVLWRYYVLELKQQIQSSGTLGPTSGGLTALATVAAEQLVVAAFAGLIVAVIGRLSQPRRTA